MTSYPLGSLRSGFVRTPIVTMAAQAAPAAVPAANPAANPVVFSFGPSIANEDLIDYETPNGAKSYRIATAKLQEELFDCEPVGIMQFLSAIKNRSMQCGWQAILQVPKDMLTPNVNKIDMVTKYGDVSLHYPCSNICQCHGQERPKLS